MSLFQVCSIEHQIALVEQMKKLSTDSVVNDVRDKCPELKDVLNEYIPQLCFAILANSFQELL